MGNAQVRALAARTGRKYMGRAFIGDGIATIVAGSAGGIGTATFGAIGLWALIEGRKG